MEADTILSVIEKTRTNTTAGAEFRETGKILLGCIQHKSQNDKYRRRNCIVVENKMGEVYP
jgi:hypothetical protein